MPPLPDPQEDAAIDLLCEVIVKKKLCVQGASLEQIYDKCSGIRDQHPPDANTQAMWRQCGHQFLLSILLCGVYVEGIRTPLPSNSERVGVTSFSMGILLISLYVDSRQTTPPVEGS